LIQVGVLKILDSDLAPQFKAIEAINDFIKNTRNL